MEGRGPSVGIGERRIPPAVKRQVFIVIKAELSVLILSGNLCPNAIDIRFRLASCFSMHNFGLAFNVVPLDGGKPVWNVSNPGWQKVGMTGKECGPEWAGDWKRFREYAPFQYTGGLSLAEIREWQRPGT
jgi:hypothetical protein